MNENEREASPIAAPEPPPPAQQRWMLGAVVAALLGLLLYLAIQYTGPSAVSDSNLESEAVSAVQEGRAIEAAEHYGELASRAMDNRERASWMLEQAAALVMAQLPEQAVTVLQGATALDVGDEDLRNRIRLRLAAQLSENGDPAAAFDLYSALAADEKTSPEYTASALLGLLDMAQLQGDDAPGWAGITAALLRYPDNPEVALALARNMSEVLVARDRGEDAKAVLEILPGETWDALEQSAWLLARARIHDDLGELDSSLALYEQALEVVGEEGEEAQLTRFEVASLRARRGDLEQARTLLIGLDTDAITGELRGLVKLQLAEVMRQSGEGHSAETLYRQVIEGWPELDDAVSIAREGLGSLLVSTDDGGLAAEELFVALEAGGEGADAAVDVLLGMANSQLARGEPQLALASYERVRAAVDEPGRYALAADQGRAYALIQLDRNDDALELLREIRNGLDAEQRLLIDAQIGQTLLRTGQHEAAAAAFQSLLEVAEHRGFGTSAALLGLAEVAEAQERYEEALHLYQQVLATPQGVEQQVAALQAMAPLELQLGRDEEALLAYRQLVQLLPTDGPTLDTIRVAMAEVYAFRGDIERERALWGEILLDATPAASARGRIRLVELDMAAAAEDQDRAGLEAALRAMHALRGAPDMPADMVPDVVFGEIVCLFELERYDDAIELIGEALELGLAGPDPEVFLTLEQQAQAALRGEPIDRDLVDMPEPGSGPSDEQMASLLEQVAQAGALRDQGSTAAALEAFAQLLTVIEDRPTQASVRREMAQTFAAQGDLDAARETLTAVIETYPELPESIFLAGLSLAELQLQEQDPSAALTLLAQLEPPDEGHAIWKLQLEARAHSTAGDTEAALRTWREAIELAEGDPEGSVVAWTGLGDLYMQLGEPDHASDAFQRAAVLAPEGAARVQSQLRAAQVSIETGRLDEVADVLDELGALQLEGELAVQVALTASALEQERGDWQAGLDAARAVSPDGVGPDYHAQLMDAQGVCLLALEKVEQARTAYEQLAQRWPGHAEVDAVTTFGLAEVEAANDDIPAAVERLEAYVQRSADRFRQGQALLRLAQIHENHAQPEAAQLIYRRVKDEYADEPELAESAARALD